AIFMDGIYGVTITGNSIYDGNSNAVGILLNNCTAGVAYPNAMAGFTTPISVTGTSIGNSPTSIQYQPIFNGKAATANFTTGAIPFVNGANQFSEAPTQLFWDNTNARMGVGRTPTTEKLEVQGSIMIGSAGTPAIGIIHGDAVNKGTGGSFRISSSPSVATDQYADMGTFAGTTFTPRIRTFSSGVIQWPTYTTAGLLTNDVSGNITSTLVLPAATTATTPAPLDNSLKLSTTAYADALKSAVATLTNKTLTTPVLTAYTVATLPTGLVQGAMAYVTDATAPTYNGTLTGGGTVKTVAVYNGTVWTAH
ncbi:hypothetical protein QN344_05605, partial [Mucilaginibacter sp. 5B2]|nr:hypothetical protein [Mucilaginibacter sp. 5B2]